MPWRTIFLSPGAPPRAGLFLADLMHWMRPLALSIIAAAVASAGLPGCARGPVRGEVRGKVTFKGQPVKEGSIEFLNPTQGGAAEATVADGNYEVQGGLVVGDYVVIVSPVYYLHDPEPTKTPAAMMPKPAPDIPMKYRNQDTTTLKATVKEGKNEFNFDLTP
jgi:hypothetical protein